MFCFRYILIKIEYRNCTLYKNNVLKEMKMHVRADFVYKKEEALNNLPLLKSAVYSSCCPSSSSSTSS